jgi:hypothetical protein
MTTPESPDPIFELAERFLQADREGHEAYIILDEFEGRRACDSGRRRTPSHYAE